MSFYNTTNLTTSIGYTGKVQAVNQLSGGVLAPLFLLALFIVVLLMFSSRNDFAVSYWAASMITAIMGILLNLAAFLPRDYLIIVIVNAGLVAWTGDGNSQTDILEEIYKNRSIEMFLTGMRFEDSRRFHLLW